MGYLLSQSILTPSRRSRLSSFANTDALTARQDAKGELGAGPTQGSSTDPKSWVEARRKELTSDAGIRYDLALRIVRVYVSNTLIYAELSEWVKECASRALDRLKAFGSPALRTASMSSVPRWVSNTT